MKQCFFSIPSMHSLESARTVSNIIENISGVKNVDADYENSQVGVFCENNNMMIEKISSKVQESGFKINLL